MEHALQIERLGVYSRYRNSRQTSRPCCNGHTVTAASTQAQQHQQPLPSLRDWIRDHGGYIHPSLQLTDHAPVSHCRGVIAASPISIEDLEAGPIVSIPQELQFTSSSALSILASATSSQQLVTAAQEQLSDVQLLAAALAHTLSQLKQHSSSSGVTTSENCIDSSNSFWFPYLLSLPAVPPNPWLLNNPALVLAALRPNAQAQGQTAVAGWAEAVAEHRQQMLTSAAEIEKLLGSELNLTTDNFMTAFGHVMSRSLTSGSSSSGLVPFVDLLNHNRHARAPMLQLDDNDKLVITVLPIFEDEAVPLAAGDELLISYQGGYSPLEAFLKFGFVAEEWWSEDG